jgi:hypothetical protein
MGINDFDTAPDFFIIKKLTEVRGSFGPDNGLPTMPRRPTPPSGGNFVFEDDEEKSQRATL